MTAHSGNGKPEIQHNQQTNQHFDTQEVQTRLIQLAHDAIMVCNPDRQIVSWNRGAELLYGWTEEEARGQITHTLLQTCFPYPLAEIEAELFMNDRWEGQLQHTCREGKQITVESRWEMVRDTDGEPLAILEINRDITMRVALLRQQIEAEARAASFREQTQQMETLLSVVSHELKNPLAASKGNIQLAKRQLQRSLEQTTSLPEQVRSAQNTILHLLERAERQSSLQQRLLNDLLDVSRVAAHRLELRMGLCDVIPIVREAVADQRIVAPGRTINLETECDEIFVMADADRLGQVVTNYLSNALKYSESATQVRVQVGCLPGQVRVSVQDEGPGLTPEEQKHIWEQFYRVNGIEVKTGGGVGLGLGLYICRIIIERMGGQVGVQSAKDKGSTFWFTLPQVAVP